MRNEWIQERMNAVKEQGKARARALFEALPEEVDKRQLKAGIEVLFNGLPDQAIADDGLPGPIFWNVREHPYLASDTYGTLMVKAERQRGVFLCRVLAYVDKACLSKRLNQTLADEHDLELVLVGEDQLWVEMASFDLRKQFKPHKVPKAIVESGRILFDFIYRYHEMENYQDISASTWGWRFPGPALEDQPYDG